MNFLPSSTGLQSWNDGLAASGPSPAEVEDASTENTNGYVAIIAQIFGTFYIQWCQLKQALANSLLMKFQIAVIENEKGMQILLDRHEVLRHFM